jgi:hypothetical protein
MQVLHRPVMLFCTRRWGSRPYTVSRNRLEAAPFAFAGTVNAELVENLDGVREFSTTEYKLYSMGRVYCFH